MAITFVSAGTTGEGLGTVSPGVPAGYAEDDIFILHIEGEDEDTNPDGQGDFGGTLIGSFGSDAQSSLARSTRNTLYWKRATASESAPTVSDAGQHTLAVITAWRGCVAAGDPVHQSQSSGEGEASANTSVSATGVTTTIDNCMIVIAVNNGDDTTISGWTNANLDSITEAVDIGTIEGSDGSIAVAYGILSTQGATGATTATVSGVEQDANWVIALEPATGGVGTNTTIIVPTGPPLS